jgi:hypothetical protein
VDEVGVALVPEALWREAGRVEQSPERISAAGEVVTELRGARRGVDADEEDAEARRDDVAER